MRILVADDDRSVLAAYEKAFATLTTPAQQATLADMAADLFGDRADRPVEPSSEQVDVTYVDQGMAAVDAVLQARESGAPFQVVFLDMRMPPGIDGREAAKRIRAIDPDIHLVMVTGYSDSSPMEVARVAGPLSKFYYVAKPFEVDEILQMARALSEKWRLEADLALAQDKLREQIDLLERTNIQLAASEARVRHAAYHDALTGAPNRAAFLRELAHKVTTGASDFSVVMLDLDRFKAVNDSLGHAAGDELIRMTWEAIDNCLPPDATAARLGGDEFGIILQTIEEADLQTICARLVSTCSEVRSIFGHTVKVGASAGAAVALPTGERDPIDIVRRADLALYAAKNGGRGQARVFDKSLDESTQFRLLVERELRTAILSDQLSLVYQPIVSQDNLDVVGFEALVRWNSPERGPVPPSVFVPIAEETGLIHELSRWVVPKALEACRNWEGRYVSINFSPRQFHKHGLKEFLQAEVNKAGLTPDRVQIEITETALFDDADMAAQILTDLQDAGFRIALDDFGTGYSSLFNLKNFSIDCIKVDKSFVAALGKEPNATAIVSSVAQLARSLGLNVVAEGVEDQFQHNALRLAGCSHMQGYRFGRPVNGRGAQDYLASGTKPAAVDAARLIKKGA